jgi:hypothetical protein
VTAKWLAVVLMWVAGAGAIVGTAASWGIAGRGTTLALGVVLGVVLFLSTAMIAQTEKGSDG